MRYSRLSKGATIAEAGAAMALMIPLLFAVLFVVLEASQAYMIKEALAQGARQAARNLAVEYGKDSAIQYRRDLQDAQVFSQIRLVNVINANEQFSDPVWNTSASPPTVTVTVTYTPNQHGLAPFPNPDPLNLGPNFVLNANSTYRLE
jgi:Flp pilus assembly protein TadG